MYTIEKQRLTVVRDSSVTVTDAKASNPQSIGQILDRLVGDSPTENFIVLGLSAKLEVVGASIVSIGDIGSAIVTPRQVFSYALLVNARMIVVGHNHPSGCADPSPEDISLTKRLIEAGKILGIQVLDHVVIGKGSNGVQYYSFHEHGLI